MRRAIFWCSLIAANFGVVLLMVVDRCTCGVPEVGELLIRFVTSGGIFAVLFALISLPLALVWRALALRRSIWRPLSVPKMLLASALFGSFFYGYLDHKWLIEERYESVAHK